MQDFGEFHRSDRLPIDHWIDVRGTPTFAATTAFQPFPHLPPPVPMPAAAPDFPAVRKPQSLTPISAHL
jgi:hypothetical protein